MNFIIVESVSQLTFLFHTQFAVATETFKRFDKRGQDKISTNDLGPAFSALKASIKPDLLKEWADEVDDDGESLICPSSFKTVYNWASRALGLLTECITFK